ncbi:MAG: hypothetical protein AB7D28_07995 [Candidatus Berkiella sp.]
MPFPIISFDATVELSQTQYYLKAAIELLGAEAFEGPGRDYNGFPEILFRAANLGEYLNKSETASIMLFHQIARHPEREYTYRNFNSAMTFGSFVASNLLIPTVLNRYQGNPNFNKILAYHLLKSATNAYNAAALHYQDNATEQSIQECHQLLIYAYSLLNACEFLCPDAIEQDPYLQKTHHTLLENFIAAKEELQAKGIVLEVNELNTLVEKRNTIEERMFRNTKARVIFTPELKWAQRLNPSALAELIHIIQEIQTGNLPRQQIALYLSHSVGHAITLDISKNNNSQKIEIIALESTCNWQFVDALQKITDALTKSEIKHNIIACQTGLQKDGMSCTAYVLCFLSLLAKTSFQELSQKTASFHTQPDFFISSQLGSQSMSTIPNVRWFDVTALGKKAVMMGQSFTKMRSDLQKLFPDLEHKKIEAMITDLKRHYNIDSKEISSYIDYKRREYKAIASGQPFKHISWDGIAAKLTGTSQKIPPTREVALRRLAAGFGTAQELEYLISSMEELSLSCQDSGEKGYTPLHHAVKNAKEKRAFLLLSSGADPDIADKTPEHKTARQYAEELETTQPSYIKTKLAQ